jgi:hypothetical protein
MPDTTVYFSQHRGATPGPIFILFSELFNSTHEHPNSNNSRRVPHITPPDNPPPASYPYVPSTLTPPPLALFTLPTLRRYIPAPATLAPQANPQSLIIADLSNPDTIDNKTEEQRPCFLESQTHPSRGRRPEESPKTFANLRGPGWGVLALSTRYPPPDVSHTCTASKVN